jgi:hypothetical protein
MNNVEFRMQNGGVFLWKNLKHTRLPRSLEGVPAGRKPKTSNNFHSMPFALDICSEVNKTQSETLLHYARAWTHT